MWLYWWYWILAPWTEIQREECYYFQTPTEWESHTRDRETNVNIGKVDRDGNMSKSEFCCRHNSFNTTSKSHGERQNSSLENVIWTWMDKTLHFVLSEDSVWAYMYLSFISLEVHIILWRITGWSSIINMIYVLWTYRLTKLLCIFLIILQFILALNGIQTEQPKHIGNTNSWMEFISSYITKTEHAFLHILPEQSMPKINCINLQNVVKHLTKIFHSTSTSTTN